MKGITLDIQHLSFRSEYTWTYNFNKQAKSGNYVITILTECQNLQFQTDRLLENVVPLGFHKRLLRPWRLTCNQKITKLKREIIFQTSVFWYFLGSMLIFPGVIKKPSETGGKQKALQCTMAMGTFHLLETSQTKKCRINQWHECIFISSQQRNVVSPSPCYHFKTNHGHDFTSLLFFSKKIFE